MTRWEVLSGRSPALPRQRASSEHPAARATTAHRYPRAAPTALFPGGGPGRTTDRDHHRRKIGGSLGSFIAGQPATRRAADERESRFAFADSLSDPRNAIRAPDPG